MTCECMNKLISSLVLEDGLTPSPLPDGQQIDLFGPAPAHVSRSQQLGGVEVTARADTYGRIGQGSSASATLQSCLASRLVERLPSGGGIRWQWTWRMPATPSRRRYFQLRLSERRTDENGYGLWPTPEAGAFGAADPEKITARRERIKAQGINGNGFGLTLGQAAALRPTPQVTDGKAARREGYMVTGHPGTTLSDAADMSLWATPRASDGEKGGPNMKFGAGGEPLPTQAFWASPASRDYRHANAKAWKDRGGGAKGEQLPNQVIHGQGQNGSEGETERRGQLNPAFVCWLMGYPAGWDACGVTAIPSLRRSRRNS